MLRSLLTYLALLLACPLRSRAVPVAENLLLRQQLIVLRRDARKPRLRRTDRFIIAALTRFFPTLVDAVAILKPRTVIAWHRTLFRLFWRYKSRRQLGRPPIDSDLRALIRRFWKENVLWGENRIAAELAKLGYHVSPRTVAKYRPAHLPCHRGQSWSTFLRNHLHQTWACDFFVIVTLRFEILYAFVIVELGRRQILQIGVTRSPSAQYAAQRFVDAVADAGNQAPRFLVRDRDAIYAKEFRQRIKNVGTRSLVIPPRAPRAAAFCERLIGTLRRDCLDHVLIRDERHAETILREYVRYYHGRPHRGLRMQSPAGARWLMPHRRVAPNVVHSRPVLAGLHHEYGCRPLPRAA